MRINYFVLFLCGGSGMGNCVFVVYVKCTPTSCHTFARVFVGITRFLLAFIYFVVCLIYLLMFCRHYILLHLVCCFADFSCRVCINSILSFWYVFCDLGL